MNFTNEEATVIYTELLNRVEHIEETSYWTNTEVKRFKNILSKFEKSNDVRLGSWEKKIIIEYALLSECESNEYRQEENDALYSAWEKLTGEKWEVIELLYSEEVSNETNEPKVFTVQTSTSNKEMQVWSDSLEDVYNSVKDMTGEMSTIINSRSMWDSEKLQWYRLLKEE